MDRCFELQVVLFDAKGLSDLQQNRQNYDILQNRSLSLKVGNICLQFQPQSLYPIRLCSSGEKASNFGSNSHFEKFMSDGLSVPIDFAIVPSTNGIADSSQKIPPGLALIGSESWRDLALSARSSLVGGE